MISTFPAKSEKSAPTTAAPASKPGVSTFPTKPGGQVLSPAASTPLPLPPAPRCNNCGAQMVRHTVDPLLPTHAPRPTEFGCPKCGFNS